MPVEQLLAPLHPQEGALTPLFLVNVDEGMLREIAAADYGHQADACYTDLRSILHGGISTFRDFNFNLIEVLELVRWSEPENDREHWMRLFACTALIRMFPRCPTSISNEVSTLAQLVASAVSLGPAVARPTASMLAWRFQTNPGADEDPAFLAFAVLLLAAHLERAEESGPWLKELACWVETEEMKARNDQSHPEWLLGLTMFDMRNSVWRSLAHRILARPETPHPRDADEELRLLGELVAGISL